MKMKDLAEVLLKWFAFAVVVFVCWWMCERIGKNVRVRHNLKKALRINHAKHVYITSGRILNEVANLDSREIRTLDKHRKDCIKQRSLESREFHAICACPSCEVVDLHDFDSVCRKSVVKRQCKACGFLWKQD